MKSTRSASKSSLAVPPGPVDYLLFKPNPPHSHARLIVSYTSVFELSSNTFELMKCPPSSSPRSLTRVYLARRERPSKLSCKTVLELCQEGVGQV